MKMYKLEPFMRANGSSLADFDWTIADAVLSGLRWTGAAIRDGFATWQETRRERRDAADMLTMPDSILRDIGRSRFEMLMDLYPEQHPNYARR